MSSVFDRRTFGRRLAGAVLSAGTFAGCRGNQYAEVRDPAKADMVGSHAAGAETFKPLVEQAVGQLLARHSAPLLTPTGELAPQQPKRVCFVAVENKSAEEIGDFKDQLYQTIDMHIVQSQAFQPINKRYIDAGLMQCRLRPDVLLVPQNMRTFAAVMEQQQQPFDFLLYATVTSGTTRSNKEMQRDYQLTLEMVNVHNGFYDKQAATISKGYHHSMVSKLMSQAGLKR
ncbi:MAG: penicillin-binding protein activator LpoB [Planctomycetia bacterium]|nr:penicillin-binding protein activator LpoB [Planctomycetia bacterium]